MDKIKPKLYSEYREHISQGDMLVWASNPFIQIMTRSKYTHTAIAMKHGTRLYAFEARLGGVRNFPMSNKNDFYHIPMGIDWKEEYTDYCDARIGEPYSIYAAVISVIVNPKINGAWQCSELTKHIYQRLGFKLNGDTTPDGLIQDIMDLGYVMSKVINDRKGTNTKLSELPFIT